MKGQSRSARMWSVLVVGLCVLWFTHSAGAIPLESWDDIIPNATQRFKVLTEFGDAAVLDRETGLVWERSPDGTPHDWNGARFECTSRTTGNRKGWRLPSMPELASLVDPSVAAPGPTLPPGHPFLNVQSNFYWSATTTAEDPSLAWYVLFTGGGVTNRNKTGSLLAWCVRGGMNADVY